MPASLPLHLMYVHRNQNLRLSSAGRNRKKHRLRNANVRIELKKTEERITELEERDGEIDELMVQEEIYTNSVKCQELALEKSKIAEELEELYARWEELA